MILAVDQGTTSTRVMIFNEDGEIQGKGQVELPQYYPKPGWVQHEPEEIWTTTVEAIRAALADGNIKAEAIRALGIANQRETTIVWDRRTGKPIHPAIVWQCRRSADICDRLRERGVEEEVTRKTGLIIDPYFSATKIRWLLDAVEGAQQEAERGHLAFGTVDSWLIWKLTGGQAHVSDYTNASRTLLFNIHKREWDDKLLSYLKIPRSMMPQVKFSSVMYGKTSCSDLFPKPVTISGVAGDQQAALYGQCCYKRGQAKVTYGTGAFLLQHTGDKAATSEHGLLTTIAVDQHGGPAYALEGAVFNAGSAVQWLRDGLGIIATAAESEKYALAVPDTGGVYVVPAFTGMGAPYWNMAMRGSIFGLTRGTARHHLIRATLESLAYQAAEVLDALAHDSKIGVPELRVDGGAARNDFLVQFQADISGVPVIRPTMQETTAAGAALLAGIGAGIWTDPTDAGAFTQAEHVFEPKMSDDQRIALRGGWRRAVKAAMAF